MSKPLIEDTRWAVTVGGVESPAQSSPDGGLKDGGYANDDIPDPRDWNFWHRKAHSWFQYLNNAALSGDHSIDGALTVGGQALVFTPRTFTADFVTDNLAVTGHGLSLGDGPLELTTTGTLPGNLQLLTNYWAVPTDSDHFQIALSKLNALDGLVVDVNAIGGSGTHTVSSVGGVHPTDATCSRDMSVAGALSTGRGATIGGQPVSLASVAFTANVGTNKLQLGENHGLETGDGPLDVTNSGGALPSPLVAATPYWAIRTDVDEVQVAVTRADALAGNPLILLSTGSGVNTIASVSATRAAGATVTGVLSAAVMTGYRMNQQASCYRLLVGSITIGHPVAFSNTATIIHPLSLPVGFVITRLSISYNRGVGTASQFVKLALIVDNVDVPAGGAGAAFTTTSLITDTTSTGDQLVSTSNLGVDASGFPTAGAGSLTIRGDRAYALAVVAQPDGGAGAFPLFFGTKVNA